MCRNGAEAALTPGPGGHGYRGPIASALLITADDYGYSRLYNDGILRAAAAGGIDAVSAMVTREACDPAPLLESGVEVGLHLELAASSASPRTEIERQLDRFRHLFGRLPSHVDGHHHCHLVPPALDAVGELAAGIGLRVRSVGEEDRRRLRELGASTPDRLIGRLRDDHPPLPAELERVVTGAGPAPPGLTEWMVHPGLADPAAGSSLDAARLEDLELLLELSQDTRLRTLRAR
jgi:predicted glycoside hydrolase/deacetylase ChbG (UPF0249 family)